MKQFFIGFGLLAMLGDVQAQIGIDIDTFVVSESRFVKVWRNIPSRKIQIDAKDVMLANPQTAADLLSVSGEVFMQKSQQGGGSPMIRGFAANRLLYTIDGVRMNTAIFRSGNLQNVISLDPFAIANTEIFLGAGAVQYGSDAIGGVMTFETLSPQLAADTAKLLLRGNLAMRYSSANKEQTAHFDINVGGQKWAALTSVSRHDFSDLRMGSHGRNEYLRPFYVQRQDSADVLVANTDPRIQRPTGYEQWNLMQKLRFSPNAYWDFNYAFHYSETSNYGRYDRHIRYRNGLPRYAEWDYGAQKWQMNYFSAAHKREKGAYSNAKLTVSQQYFEESRISRNMNSVERLIQTEKVGAYAANIDLRKELRQADRLFYGVEAVWNRVNSIGEQYNLQTQAREAAASRYPQSDWATFAAYVSYQRVVRDNFLLQGGLRYNQFMLKAAFDTSFYGLPFSSAELNNGALTGELGFMYHIGKFWQISGNLATAFRAPNIDDMGKIFDVQAGAVVVPNKALKAERAYNAELNFERKLGEKSAFEGAVYYTNLQNAMVRRDYTLAGRDSIMYQGVLSRVQAIQNASQAYVWGAHLGFRIGFGKYIVLASKINYQYGREELEDGNISPLRHAAPIFGSSILAFSAQNWRIEINAQYSGGRTNAQLPQEEQGKPEIYATDTAGLPFSPAWYVVNFKSEYVFAKKWRIGLGLENISDVRYRAYSSGIAGAGRNLILSVRGTF